eukprot:g2499.t1
MNSLHLFLALAAVVVGCASALECGANNCYSGDTTALGGAGRGTCNTVTGNCTCNKGSGHGQTAFDEIVQKYGLDYANSFKNGTDGVYTWPYAHQFLWQYTGRDCQTLLWTTDSLLSTAGNAMWPIYGSNSIPSILSFGFGASALALVMVLVFTMFVMAAKPGTPEMVELAEKIHKGAKSFLHAEYKWLTLFVIVIFASVSALLTDSLTPAGVNEHLFGIYTALPLLLGAILSAGAGYGGMWIATKANVRTTHACEESINKGLSVAFKSGAVMSLSVTGLGLFGLTLMYLVYAHAFVMEQEVWQYLSGFGFGASCIALFARVGGGCYTKAADVGADLVGKVEAGIPEDHPNNAAVIADNVGDNVGDVAGMGADLFESFVGSIIAACTLATTQFVNHSTDLCLTKEQATFPNGAANGGDCTGFQKSALALPFWIAGCGIFCSIIGTFLVRTNATAENTKGENELLEKLLWAINRAIYITVTITLGFCAMACFVLFTDQVVAGKIFACIAIGLVIGNLIAFFTEYSTSYTYSPTRGIANKGRTGPATVIIQGLGVGMIGTIVPTVLIVVAICACNALAGLYGIAIAAVGMLSTLGITLATDAYGPVADNAGGIAEMISSIPERVRDNTDALDAMGNTTAATGKGFAIGSAVLTAAALIAAYMDAAGLTNEPVSIRDPLVLSGLLIGASLPFVFAAITMLSVGKAAEAIIFEVREQFQRHPELKTELDNPEVSKLADYEACIRIATDASIKEMVIPGGLAVFMPPAVGLILSSKGLAGMLIGSLTSGFMLAVAMSNAGGAWDNAKKYVEKSGAKGSEQHKATVVGDTVGDPFHDTSGPALNILIKLMS